MHAAATARMRWARRRSGAAAGSPMPGWGTARISTILLLVLAVAMVACAVIGLTATQRDDTRLEAERHAALQRALDDAHVAFGDANRFDPGQIQLIERRAGLAELRFDADLTADSGREVQSLHDGEGRILGWFSWVPDRALVRAMNWLWGIVGAVGVVLAVCAFLAMRATRRLGGSLARNIEAVRKLTSQDVLTSLPNRRVMLESLEQVMATRRSEAVAFVLIDVDSFHEINDTLGRAGGDAMLISIAERLRACLPAGALFGRFEDDEFAVIAKCNDSQSTAKLADALAASLAAPIFMDQNWHISVSVGMAQAPEDGNTGDELQRRAALALRAAKRGGRGTMRRFVPQIQEEHSERRFFRRELETAIAKRTLDVHYQPVVAAAGGGIVGVEALARWTHPTRGVIAPSTFIPLAEQSGLMIQLGEFVLRRALTDAARWPNLFVSINLSPVQMRNRGIVDLLRTGLAESGVAASRVVLEVTESILIDNPEETQERLEALRRLGASVALDDFGSGYSSLNYLQKFPFDRLKIDRGFVASLGTSGTAGAIIQAIVTLGHALGMKVLAEGVETDEQRVLLRLTGCDEMQGYLFAKPRPAAAIDKALTRSAVGRSAARQSAAPAS
jgi:diguanylate cyclase (GGDEF)-like protein